jgi:hypothetical protein
MPIVSAMTGMPKKMTTRPPAAPPASPTAATIPDKDSTISRHGFDIAFAPFSASATNKIEHVQRTEFFLQNSNNL